MVGATWGRALRRIFRPGLELRICITQLIR